MNAAPQAIATSPVDRVSLLFDGSRRRTHEIVTPEGVALRVDVAERSERLGAFLLDLLFWMVGTVVIFLGLLFAVLARHGKALDDGDVATTIVLFLGFLFRNLYFMHFELAWRGRTPGKRIMGLRVIDRAGGALTASAIVARNITREVEFFLPAEVFLSLAVTSGVGAWAQLATFGWIAAIGALPFFNREHLRAGDLIAGTLVIAMPKRVLAPDLSERAASYAFTPQQLRTYGTFELQVLEELLRQPASAETSRLYRKIVAKICGRIGWTTPVPPAEDEPFLRAFYTAERADLEREQLFGRGRADKDAARGR